MEDLDEYVDLYEDGWHFQDGDLARGPEDLSDNEGDQASADTLITSAQQHRSQQHDAYRNVRERGATFVCGLCTRRYPDWIRECRDCGIHVCARCR